MTQVKTGGVKQSKLGQVYVFAFSYLMSPGVIIVKFV